MSRPLALICSLLVVGCGPTPAGRDADTGDDGPDAVYDPDNDGDGYPQSVDCDDNDPTVYPGAPEICDDGKDNNCNGLIDDEDPACWSPCDRAALEDSNYGCRIYALDLPQFSLDKKFAIIVSNPSVTETANVTVSTAGGQRASFAVAPRSLHTFEEVGRPYNISGAGVHALAYLVESDLPVAAYQFNSLDTIGAASTDASLLFAEHTLARLYFSMDYTARATNDGFIAVYATEPDTLVEIEPAAPVNGATSATLQPFQVLVVTSQSANTNLTGSRVSASAPVGVFGGNRCTNVPYGMDFCDHVEQQIFPRKAIGTRYIVGKLRARSVCDPPDYVRVMADVDGTTVTFDPPVAGPWALSAGQWMETSISQSVEITANHPILVGQFMRSSNGSACDHEGDPAFLLQVPVEQYRPDYVFLTPPTYDTDYVDILAPIGTTVTLDGAPVALSATPIGATGYSLTSLIVPEGAHVLQASAPVGVMVYGVGGPDATGAARNVSYGYPAGLELSPINPIE